MSNRNIAIETVSLVKTYTAYDRIGFFKRVKKRVKALRGVSFKVYKGEVFGLLGPNGAGKTTTVKILSTLLLPDSGDAYILGHHVIHEATKVRKLIGVSLSVERGFFWKLTGRENLKYFGMLYGLDGPELDQRVDELLVMLGLEELGAVNKLYEEYSLGMKARLSIARTLLTDPPVLILDEPTLGLDPPSARCLREMLVQLAHKKSKTVLITTHNMFEAEIICDRVAIIDKGQILAVDTVDGLKRRVADVVPLEITVYLPAQASIEHLTEILKRDTSCPVKIFPEEKGHRIKILSPPDTVDETTSRALKSLYDQKCNVRKVEVKQPSLEDVFIKLTGKTGFR